MRPVQAEDSTEIKFERKNGEFKRFCKEAIFATADDIPSTSKVPEISIDDDVIRNVYNSILEKIREGEEIIVKLGKNKEKIVKEISEGNLGWERGPGAIANPDIASPDFVIRIFHDFPSKESFSNLNSTYVKANYGGDGGMRWAISNLIWKEIERQGVNIYKNSDTIVHNTDINRSSSYVFIIDEINRGEISKIFGELFFAIEPNYRGNTEIKIKTQYQNLILKDDPFAEGFYVPENVYILATMNDIDRSVESMDFAIRRRFAWKEVLADENTAMLEKINNTGIRDKAHRAMTALNNEIGKIEGLGTSFHIGASYFLKMNDYDTDKFKSLWDYHLKGLLYDYLRGVDQSEETLEKLRQIYYEAIEDHNTTEG